MFGDVAQEVDRQADPPLLIEDRRCIYHRPPLLAGLHLTEPHQRFGARLALQRSSSRKVAERERLTKLVCVTEFAYRVAQRLRRRPLEAPPLVLRSCTFRWC